MPRFFNPNTRILSPWDYVIFAMLFIISSIIGIYFAFAKSKHVTSKDFMVGGRQMKYVPVALSLTASFMSAITVIGSPSDVYRFGASFSLFCISYGLVVIVTAQLFLPVFYQSGITSTYEYLELRFSRTVREATTILYIVQTLLYAGIVVYAPALALNQVTGFDLWGSVAATGIVCTFYCTVGGLNAVVWTDVFQLIVMVLGFLTILIRGTFVLGGFNAMWNLAKKGERLHVVDFSLDPLRRHTFWTITVGGTFTWLGIYGVNQSIVQRCVSCKSESQARKALYLNVVGLWLINLCAVFSGLIMYVYYMNCDPWTAEFISAPDQLLPYFVMEILGDLPGLPGLFVACAFGGTLSTVAASINALATVTHEAFIKHYLPNISDNLDIWFIKGLCIIFGIICTIMAVAASLLGGILQAALSILGMCGGPVLGLFSLGILFPCSQWIGALGGLGIGIILSFWPAISAFIYPTLPKNSRPLFLNVTGCIPLNNSIPYTTERKSYRPPLADNWYAMSYLYYSPLGFLGSLLGGLIISAISGSKYGKIVDPSLMRPISNLFQYWPSGWCGVHHKKRKPEDNSEKKTLDDAQILTE